MFNVFFSLDQRQNMFGRAHALLADSVGRLTQAHLQIPTLVQADSNTYHTAFHLQFAPRIVHMDTLSSEIDLFVSAFLSQT